MSEIYISVDVETDGPIPGPHSLLSLGAAAYLADKTLAGTYSANLETLPGASPDPETMAWWGQIPGAWRKCREDARPPEIVMPEFSNWVEAFPEKPVFVAYPAGFDFTFVYWYLIRFVGRCPFSHAALDLKTFAMALLGTEFRATTKRKMPRSWFDGRPHTHLALDDALEQGALLCSMLDEWNVRMSNAQEPRTQ